MRIEFLNMFLICMKISWSHNQCHEFWHFNLGQIGLVFFSFQEVISFPWLESQIIQHRFFFIGLSLFHDLSHGLTCWSSWPNYFFLLLLLVFFFQFYHLILYFIGNYASLGVFMVWFGPILDQKTNQTGHCSFWKI